MVYFGSKYPKFGSNKTLIAFKLMFNSIPISINILFSIVLLFIMISMFYTIIVWFSSLNITNISLNGFKQNSIHISFDESKANVLRDYHKSVEYNIEDNHSSPPMATNSSCNHFQCFDVYRCGNNAIDLTEELIGVYIYPSINFVDSKRKPILSPISQQFRELLEAIITSPYYTPNPSNACLFIPNIDLLNQMNIRLEETSRVLSSLPHWDKKGTNHLIFNMISGSFPEYNTRVDLNLGHALVAGAGFDSWTYRPTFDVSIPVFSLFSNEYKTKRFDENLIINKVRKWLVVCTLYESVSAVDQQILNDLESEASDLMLVLHNHCKHRNGTQMCDNRRDIALNYPNILTESTFCLVLKTVFLGHPVLSDALMSGCIPVIVSDEYVLPFEDKIDWKRGSVRIWSHSLHKTLDILKAIPNKRIEDMRRQSVFIWRTYFSSMKAIALTTLRIINERVFPNSVTPVQHWNRPHSSYMSNELAIISPKLSSRQSIGFTTVILTFDRLESLYEVIRSVVKARSCVKVLVVWNNQQKSPPKLNKWPDISVPLHVIVTKENKLSNRFLPFQSIETDAILAIDDDIVMLTPDELEFGYQVWREFPDRIVGFPSRVHRWDNRTLKWKYESEWTNDVSMVLTGAAFYHKYYNHLYTNLMPKQIKSWVDQQMNCEDIAMNFLVSNVTGKAPIKVTPRKKFKCPECTNNDMLSSDVLHHLNERSECINRFAAIYKSMPLKAVEFRADPVLYKDNLPEKLKRFNSIGSL